MFSFVWYYGGYSVFQVFFWFSSHWALGYHSIFTTELDFGKGTYGMGMAWENGSEGIKEYEQTTQGTINQYYFTKITLGALFCIYYVIRITVWCRQRNHWSKGTVAARP